MSPAAHPLFAPKPPLIARAFADLQAMLGLSEEMFIAASAAFLENEILEMDLAARDEEVNTKEQEIRRGVLEHLSYDPRRQLEVSLVLLSIVQDVERIGDMSKSLARLVKLAHKQRLGPSVEPLRAQRDRVLELFALTRACFAEADRAGAERVMAGNKAMKPVTADYLKSLATRLPVSANEAVVYAMAARMIGRVAAHLSNVASAAVVPFHRIRRALH